jgi:hypothetical protein
MRLPLFQTGLVLLALSATNAQAQNRFRGMDSNNDGVITRAEWRGNAQSFRQHDWNGDGVLSGDEMRGGSLGGPVNSFAAIDANRDGWITRSEWRMAPTDFARLDGNRDNRVSRFEFDNAASSGSFYGSDRSNAWRRGYDRGAIEGRAAGREDYVRRQRWDLEGQRELEGADSGYSSHVGSLTDYRDGYRDGFRMAYREGFDSARENR